MGEFSERGGRAAAVGVWLSTEDQEVRLTRWLQNTDLKEARGHANLVHWGSCSKWQERPVQRSWGRKRVVGTQRARSGQGAVHVAATAAGGPIHKVTEVVKCDPLTSPRQSFACGQRDPGAGQIPREQVQGADGSSCTWRGGQCLGSGTGFAHGCVSPP